MSMPRMDEESKALFASVVPPDPRIATKPMFGALACFIRGNMFAGLLGRAIFVRLPEAEREQVIQAGGAMFAPMPGRPTKEYVTLPEAWRSEPGKMQAWIERSLAWAETMPEKLPAKRKSKF